MIESRANMQVKSIHKLMKNARFRRQQGCFVAEGFKMVSEAFRYGVVRRLYVSEAAGDEYEKSMLHKMKDSEVEWVSASVFRSMSDTAAPQGILAIVEIPRYQRETLVEKKDAAILCLEDIQDPGNLGTMIRTAEGAGMTAVALSGGCVDLFNPKVVRATMGSVLRVPFYIVEHMAEETRRLRESGFSIYAAGPGAAQNYTECSYAGRVGIVIGNEANGICPETFATADEQITIPMEGEVESLNAAVSAALLMYEIRRGR